MRRKPLSPPLHNPKTGKRLSNKGKQSHSVLTINGRVALSRRWWHSSATGSLAPADEVLDPQGETITPGVREMCCRENRAISGFDQAAANLARTAQIKLSGESLRQVVEAEGRKVLAAQQAGTLPVAWTAADCPVRDEQGREVPGKTRVYTGTDGVMAPIITHAEKVKRRTKVKEKRRKCGKKRRPLRLMKPGADGAWKEFKVMCFYSEDHQRQHVSVTRHNNLVAGKILRRDANRLGFRQASERIGNIDGAPWIREQYALHLAELEALGLDFYHLSKNLHEARHSVYGEKSAEGQTWLEEMLHCFKHEGYAAAWERLVQWRETWKRSPKKKKAADELLHYVSERREMIRYPEFRANGWQIGSGPTEAQCELSVDRLKGHGRRWDQDNAEAIAALDCLERSGQWQFHFPNPSSTAA